jgi:transposase-like protein
MDTFNPGPRPSDRSQLADWYTAILNEQERSGLSVRRFALRFGINIQSLYSWKKRLTEPCGPTPGLVEVTLSKTPSLDSEHRASLVLRLGRERAVEVPVDFNAAELKRLVTTLEAC